MRKHLKIFVCFLKMNLASALEYRASFFMQVFGMVLSNSSFIFFWWLTFSKIGGTVAGYRFEDILFIWAVTSTGFGLGHILFDNVTSLTPLIISGELDTFILQPCNVLMNVLCCRTSLSSYGDFVYGVLIMCLFYIKEPSAWICYIFGSLMCAVVLTAATLFAHTLTFYLGDASLIGQFVTEFLVSFSTYPEKIYGPFVRAFMYSVIPAGVAVHIPLRLFHSFGIKEFVISLGWGIVYCILAGAFFYRGLRKYESGNVISTRL